MIKKNLVGRQWIGHENSATILDLDFIAVRFIKYYWDMEMSFGLKHLTTRRADRDEIITLIKKEIQSSHSNSIKYKTKPPTLEDLATDRMSDLRSKVIKKILIRYVLKAVLTDMKNLYSIVGANHIKFDSELVGFMKQHSRTIKNALNYSITKHLERYNKDAQYIATKIDTETLIEKRFETIQKIKSTN